MVSVTCQKCQRVFTDPQYYSKAQSKLDSHLARKNACDSTKFTIERSITFVPPNIECLNMNGLVASLNAHIRYCHVIGFIFKKLNEINKFVVWPNTKLHEVIYRRGGEPVVTTPTAFFMTFWHEVIQTQVLPLLRRDWPQFEKFTEYVLTRTTWDFLTPNEWKQSMLNAFIKSEVYRDMKEAVVSHLKMVPRGERCQLKTNMGRVQYDVTTTLYILTNGTEPWRSSPSINSQPKLE